MEKQHLGPKALTQAQATVKTQQLVMFDTVLIFTGMFAFGELSV